MQTNSQSRIPPFSIVIETANLQTADPQRLLASLESIATQVPSPALAQAVVILDSSEAPPALLKELQGRYPWISIERIPEGTDYGDQKALAMASSSGEVTIFADSDCLYEPGWLDSYLATFAARPDVGVLAGETAVVIRGPFTLAMALIFFFPRFSYETEISPARGFFGNNVAFRRDVFERCPFPSGLPIYRGQNVIYSRSLREVGIGIWRQPRARSQHAPPEGILTAIRRFFWTGRDTPRLARLGSAPADAPFQGDFEPYDRPGARVRKVTERVRNIARQQPGMFLLLPLALPIALACVASFFVGVAVERTWPSAANARMPEESGGAVAVPERRS